jgi:hypothetical protein
MARLDQQDARQFPVMEAVIERFEAIDLLAHGLRDRAGPPPGHDLNIRRQQPQHALPVKAAPEGAHGIRMGLRLMRPLLCRAIGKQHQGPDHFIAPLGLIHEAQLQLGKFRGRFHTHPFHRLCSRRAYVACRIDAVI